MRHATIHGMLAQPEADQSPCRRRISRACRACAEAKTKCQVEKPCSRCKLRGIVCDSTNPRENKQDITSNGSEVASRGSLEQLPELSHSTALDVGIGAERAQLPTLTTTASTQSHTPAFENITHPIFQPPSAATAAAPTIVPHDESLYARTNDDVPGFDLSLIGDDLFADNTDTPWVESCSAIGFEAHRKSIWAISFPENSCEGIWTFDAEEFYQDAEFFCAHSDINHGQPITLSARDRILSLMSRFSPDENGVIANFPSARVLNAFFQNFIEQHIARLDCWMHLPTLDQGKLSTEHLVLMTATGALLTGTPSLVKFGHDLYDALIKQGLHVRDPRCPLLVAELSAFTAREHVQTFR